ncbi:MAG: hypothetical protein HW376_972 [candidate division NC10 bacterium]|nr:hypothetical protein [candidate division NC10 bacterium]
MPSEGISGDEKTSQKSNRANGEGHPKHDGGWEDESEDLSDVSTLVESPPYPCGSSQGGPCEHKGGHHDANIGYEDGAINVSGEGGMEGVARHLIESPLDGPPGRAEVRVPHDLPNPGTERRVQCDSRQQDTQGQDTQPSCGSTGLGRTRHPRISQLAP